MAMGSGPPPQQQVVVPGAGWVDVASRAIVQVGFPVVVAGVLLWFLLTRFQDNMNAITTRMANNTTVVEKLITTQLDDLNELRAQSVELRTQTQSLTTIVKHAERMLEIQEERQEMFKRGRGPQP